MSDNTHPARDASPGSKALTHNPISHLIEQCLSKTLFNEMRTKNEGANLCYRALYPFGIQLMGGIFWI